MYFRYVLTLRTLHTELDPTCAPNGRGTLELSGLRVDEQELKLVNHVSVSALDPNEDKFLINKLKRGSAGTPTNVGPAVSPLLVGQVVLHFVEEVASLLEHV